MLLCDCCVSVSELQVTTRREREMKGEDSEWDREKKRNKKRKKIIQS